MFYVLHLAQPLRLGFLHFGDRYSESPVVGIGYAQVRRIENRGALETAHRALGTCGQVFRYAVATGRAQRDPIGDLRGALHPVKGEHFAAITDPKRVGELLRALDGY